ncbi:hypothetical protein WJX79_005458 [Trebouxia sp. C0005]
MSYTTALAQWAGSQCCHTTRQSNRANLQTVARKALVQAPHSACRKAQVKRHLPHATGTQIAPEDLTSAGNQDKIRELQVEDQIEDAEQEEEVQEAMERGLEAESHEEQVAAELAALETETEQPGPAQFTLNFLWLDKNIAVSVDQLFDQTKRSPVTEYFFWPRKDAWEELKNTLETKPWIQERDKIILLNKTTEIINFWQDSETKKTVEEARAAFPDCMFQGSD